MTADFEYSDDEEVNDEAAMQAQTPEAVQTERRKKRSRWPIKRKYRTALMTHLAMMGIDRNSAPTSVWNAAKYLLAAEAQNQKDDFRQEADQDEELGVSVEDNWYGNEADVRAALAVDEEKKKRLAEEGGGVEGEEED